jgi:TatD DNase family protein
MWTDSHCHLGYDGVDDDAVDVAAAAGVTRMVTVGTNAATSALAVAAASRHPDVYATVGLHPHEASHGVDTLAELLEHPDPNVVGVGECGLDYYYEHSPREAQRLAFSAQIALARQTDLALVVHTRDAWDDTFEVVDREPPPDRWIVHCFSGGPDEARKALERGAYLSFSGIVTFKNATEVQAAARLCPLERLLVETDSPFLAPVPNRGRPNQPAWVSLVGVAVARLKDVPVEDVARVTWDNATAVFRLPG